MNKYLLRSILWVSVSIPLSIYVTTFDLTNLQAFFFMYAILFGGCFTAYYNYDKYSQSKKVRRWEE